MSKIAIEGNVSGTGTLTIAAPNTNSNFTLTIPDATTTIVGTDATQTLTNKSMVATQLTGDVAAARITDALNATGSAPIFAARAWVNFNGTGVVAIRASGNVSSITDNGTGDYGVNFTTAMPDANFSVTGCNQVDQANSALGSGTFLNIARFSNALQTTSVRVQQNVGGANTLFDGTTLTVSIFR